jgi:hypothetical protein
MVIMKVVVVVLEMNVTAASLPAHVTLGFREGLWICG